jgi:hypothetical protein
MTCSCPHSAQGCAVSGAASVARTFGLTGMRYMRSVLSPGRAVSGRRNRVSANAVLSLAQIELKVTVERRRAFEDRRKRLLDLAATYRRATGQSARRRPPPTCPSHRLNPPSIGGQQACCTARKSVHFAARKTCGLVDAIDPWAAKAGRSTCSMGRNASA